MNNVSHVTERIIWHYACHIDDVPSEGGACALINGKQIAIFNLSRRGEWYATDNQCPHKQQMALSRGMTGCENDEPKVACPFHKKTFSLRTGAGINDGTLQIATFPVQVQEGKVFIGMQD
ncbi:nitrite reductase small subunit NirD [Dyadobacter tibetensis]|uniref:nitrite reductase small subunit NirD n=1 Tax=Dyadobacter tibetensis TaxID=1211851 RepID=UPI00046F5FCF|nr:nitrite reductase small subunit NirD [Dyadobacter tibetensis]